MQAPRRALVAGVMLAAGGVPVRQAAAQQEAIRLAVGASAGGTTDLVARSLAQQMGRSLNQSVVVENRPGAAGNIAAQHVANAAPDGRTLLVSYTSFSINPSLYRQLPFDPLADFTPISMLATVPSVLAVRSDFPANTLAELIALARQRPGFLTAGLGGLGSSLHMATASLKMLAGLDLLEVPYPGSVPSLTALLAGQISMMFASTQNVATQVEDGRIKLLGVTSAQRIARFPSVPAIAETVPGFESYSWYGLFGPARLPATVVAAYSAAARAATASPAFAGMLESDAGEARGGTPGELAAFVRADIARYATVVRATGARIE